jgi:hypothetical protein
VQLSGSPKPESALTRAVSALDKQVWDVTATRRASKRMSDACSSRAPMRNGPGYVDTQAIKCLGFGSCTLDSPGARAGVPIEHPKQSGCAICGVGADNRSKRIDAR